MECRLCLGKQAEKYIFDSNLNIIERLLCYCKLEVYKNDGLPEYVCKSCMKKLEDVETFINTCEESDKILRTNLCNDFKGVLKCGAPKFDENLVKEEQIEINFSAEDIENITYQSDSQDSIKKEDYSDEDDETEEKKIKKRKERKRIYSTSGQLCPICGKHYSKNALFVQHMQTHGEKKFACEECPKSFYLKEKLKAHILTHSDVRKYKCEFCEKSFKTNHHAKLHMEYVHKKSKPIPCELCGKVFYRPQYLKTHMVTHTAERKYKCEVCHKTYCLKTLLNTHMRVHTGVRPYSCHFCDSRFTVLQSLKEHERLHTGDRPYRCPICDKGFAQRGNMKSHFRYNHKGVDLKKFASVIKS